MSVLSYLKTTLKKLLRPGTRKFRLVRKIAEILTLVKPIPRDISYLEWVERTEPYLWADQTVLGYAPKISIVVPVFNPPAKYFMPMVYSVLNQTYDNWELLLVNASTKADCRQQTEQCQAKDNRIKSVNLSSNKGIAGNTNEGLKQATGEFVALLDHDDLLAPQALYEMVLKLQEDHTASIVYSDEDKVTADGEERFDPHFKPDWSPQLMRQVNYINHFSLLRKKVIDEIGGYRSGVDGAQDYDLYLRMIDTNHPVLHVPKVLYHWRTTETSTAHDFGAKDNVLVAGIKALQDHLARNDIDGKVTAIKKQPGFYKTDYSWDKDDVIAVIIMPTANQLQYKKLVEQYLVNLDDSSAKVDLFISQPVEDGEAEVPKNTTVKFLAISTSADFLEAATSLTTAKTVIVVNGGLLPLQTGWEARLAGSIEQDPEIGLVSPLILCDDKRVVYDGGLIQHDGFYRNVFVGQSSEQHTYFGNSNWARNVDSITGRCFAMRRSLAPAIAKCYTGNQLNAGQVDKLMQSDKKRIFLNSFVRFKFCGDGFPVQKSTSLFSPHLVEVKVDYGLTKMSNIPEEQDDYEDQ